MADNIHPLLIRTSKSTNNLKKDLITDFSDLMDK
jgi:hypothetical protein